MKIRRKADIPLFLVYFCDYAEWDGEKYYLKVEDITFMQYFTGECTYHRVNDNLCDISEYELTNDIVWRYRKYINKHIKKVMSV
jgi:hypothetical protein